MPRSRPRVSKAGAWLAAAAFVAVASHGAPPSAPSEAAVLAAQRDARATATDVRFLVGGGRGVHEIARATIPHARGAVVRGDVLPLARTVVVAADEAGAQDPDWGAALYRVDEGGARILARGLYHASRPLASSDGLVYVERGKSGAWPNPEEARAGRLRTDAIAIDSVDPLTGDARTLATWTGYTMHIAGESDGELLVYRVSFEGADLVGFDRASGRVRVITPLLPFARDFLVRPGERALLMSNRDARDTHLWVIDRVDLATGARTRVAEQRDEAPVPFAPPRAAWALRLGTSSERIEPIGGDLR